MARTIRTWSTFLVFILHAATQALALYSKTRQIVRDIQDHSSLLPGVF